MEINKIGQMVELQAIGGYFTESFPTNFHHFYKRKVLVGNETADMFKDVTASEKSALEAQDAKWIEPSVSLIERSEAAGISYNKATGFFEYNTLTDITASEMEIMLAHVNEIFLPGGRRLVGLNARTNVVTASSFPYGWNVDWFDLSGVCVSNNKIEVLKIGDVQVDKTVQCGVYNCSKIRKIIGQIDMQRVTDLTYGAFTRLPSLEDFTFLGLRASIGFPDSPLLSLASLQYLVNNATNTSPITVTVHPDVYAKLTDEDNAEWNAVLTSAEARQIEFVTTE